MPRGWHIRVLIIICSFFLLIKVCDRLKINRLEVATHIFFSVVLEVPPFTAVGVEAGFFHSVAEGLSMTF